MVNFDINFNVISFFAGILGWIVIGMIAFHMLKKQVVKPKGWKIVIIIFIGLFSFSINWNTNDTLLKFSILPLGVWILYFVLNRKDGRWETYRPFAWLGFFANYIFLLNTLVSIPIQSAIYPENEASTYISSVEKASIMAIHPSAKDYRLNKEKLLGQLPTMKQEAVFSELWYQETYESANGNERFPYQLMCTTGKWGSETHSSIYIEEDGKGILISTPKNQFYFRSESSFLKGANSR